MNRRVLIVSYYFPPLGFSGALRGYYLALFLNRKGYDVTVVTTGDVKYPAYDTSLKLPENINVIRLKTSDPQKYFSGKGKGQMGILRKINAHIFPLDNKIIWVPTLKREIDKIANINRPDVMISTSPPPSIHLACMNAAKKYGIKWIADLRDSITDNQLKSSNKVTSFFEHAAEEKIVTEACKITVVTENILSKLRKKYPCKKDKFLLVRNGFNAEDFKNSGKFKGEKGKINIAYISRISHLTDIESFLEAMSKTDNVVLHFAGVDTTGELKGLIHKYALEERVIQYGYLKHLKAIELIKSADILLITLADIKGIEDVTTAKLYEYFGSQKPILLIAPHGTEAEKLIKEENAGVCVRNGKTEAIIKAVEKLSDKRNACSNPQNYTWEHSFKRMIQYLDCE